MKCSLEFVLSKIKTNKIWIIINMFFFVLFIGFIIGIMIGAHYIHGNTPDDVGAISTVDGLITTSSFAFVAFISISPNNSGSSISMSRVSWKGFWWFRYPVLLIVSVLLTVVDLSVMNIDLNVMVAGTILSSLILILIIIKYTLFNKNLNKNSAVWLIFILKNSQNNKDNKAFKKNFRNLVHPLRDTGNIDYINELFKQVYIMDSLKEYVGDGTNKKIKVLNNANNDVTLERLLYIVENNKALSINSKGELAAWLTIQLINIDYIKFETAPIILSTIFRTIVRYDEGSQESWDEKAAKGLLEAHDYFFFKYNLDQQMASSKVKD